VNLTDDAEVNTLNTDLRSPTLTLPTTYTGAEPPVSGNPQTFTVHVQSSTGGLDHPQLALTLPANSTLNSVRINSHDQDCDPVSGGQVTCRLPNGMQSGNVVVSVTPGAAAIGSKLTLGAAASALNANQVTSSASSTNNVT
jgi:hypothetical protein